MAAGTDPITEEVIPADSPYNQPEIIRGLFVAINEISMVAGKGKQDLAWNDEEDELLTERLVMAPGLKNLPNCTPRLTGHQLG